MTVNLIANDRQHFSVANSQLSHALNKGGCRTNSGLLLGWQTARHEGAMATARHNNSGELPHGWQLIFRLELTSLDCCHELASNLLKWRNCRLGVDPQYGHGNIVSIFVLHDSKNQFQRHPLT